MLNPALDLAMLMLVAALLLTGVRLLRGPDVLDRVLALDAMYVNAAGLLVLYGLRIDAPWHFEAALVVALFGSVGTFAFARFLLRGELLR